MPPNWRDQYLSGIKDAELNNPVNMELIQTCSYKPTPPRTPPHYAITIAREATMMDKTNNAPKARRWQIAYLPSKLKRMD